MFRCMEAEMKVASVHQSVQSSPNTDSAPHFHNKVQIPEILSNLDKINLHQFTAENSEDLKGDDCCIY